ncbi:uncharacterized protein [Aegilops tauschii subsp. strangulata]|uniref:uncharacterized protein n=1 Tax=Aegilops tauschii subsp. strangulata TaxID=200361 RepID=UPI00098A8E81|nr:uncharacterized protein LOC109776888 [Aegilops tauschii subsp. strangulata]
MSKLDGFFCNEDWDITFDKHILHALSSSLSGHCPLLLANDDGPRRPQSFRFENFWTNMSGFQQVILEAWSKPSQHHDPFLRLFHKLKKTSQKLRGWSRTLFSNAKVQLHMALEIILRLDEAQDVWSLSTEEADLRKGLKKRVVGLAVLERARKKQSSRITNIKEGDANTRYFHLRVNARRRKNLIHRLKQGNDWVTDHEHKKNIVHSHFSEIMKRGAPLSKTINWATIPQADHDLSMLGDAITEEEVKTAIFALPSDKATGPDGFTRKFFKSCWEIIKNDILLEDVQFLTTILASFGESTGLSTNCAKSIVAPIRCANVDLDDILQSFPACRSSFPIRYLGLPLVIKRLKRIHLQLLEDKLLAN